jgi:hypothetical protein
MSSGKSFVLPDDETLREVSKLAILDDKVIKLDYWQDSLEKEVYIGIEREVIDGKNVDKQKILIRSDSEYTSSIIKIFRKNANFIIVTENSLYVVHSGIAIKQIAA